MEANLESGIGKVELKKQFGTDIKANSSQYTDDRSNREVNTQFQAQSKKARATKNPRLKQMLANQNDKEDVKAQLSKRRMGTISKD